MSVTSTIVRPVADALKTTLETIGPPVYLWSPGLEGLDQVPCFVIFLPDLQRVGVEGKESQLGSNDWNLTIPVALYFDLDVARDAQDKALAYIEAAIVALNADPSLNGTVLDAKVTRAEPNYESADEARPTISYEFEIGALVLASA